jgi:hypothetical protein
MNKLKTISLDPQYLNISKKKIKPKPIITHEVNINSNNIKQLLLEKLRQHKKNKKTIKQPMIRLNTLDEQNSSMMPKTISVTPPLVEKIKPETISIETETVIKTDPAEPAEPAEPTETEVCEIIEKAVIQPDRPYGVLKNGTKPTFKDWSKQDVPEIESFPDIIEEREIKNTFVLGKKNKSVGVLIKNNISRRKIEMDKLNYKKTNLATLKNHLKKHNFIKFGTTAPSELLREMYEGVQLCGEITNSNATNIVHNFKES